MAYKEKDTKKWTAQWFETNAKGEKKKRRKRGFSTKKEALEYERQKKLNSSRSMDMKLSEFMEVYFEDKQNELKERTMKNKRYMMEQHIIPYFGNQMMSEISASQIIQWQNEMQTKGFSESYLRMIQNQLTSLFTHASRIYDLHTNPSTTLFQMIRSKIFISDCVVFFDTIATFIQTIAGWIILTGKNMAQISNGISNPVVAGIVYWLIRILICGGCLVGAGILVAFIEIKIAELYKKCCWDMITIMVILISMATAIYFGKWIKTTLPINLLFLLLFVQLVYVGIRWYVKGWRETRGYH